MATTFVQIGSTVTVGSGGAATIDFTSIPATYTDLVLKLSSRTNYAGINDYASMTINGNTASLTNRFISMYGGNTVVSGAYGSPANKIQATVNGANATSNTFGSWEMYLPNYAGSSNKSFSIDSVTENNATNQGEFMLNAGLWANTSAITSINIAPYYGTLFVQYSTATLYGIKNS